MNKISRLLAFTLTLFLFFAWRICEIRNKDSTNKIFEYTHTHQNKSLNRGKGNRKYETKASDVLRIRIPASKTIDEYSNSIEKYRELDSEIFGFEFSPNLFKLRSQLTELLTKISDLHDPFRSELLTFLANKLCHWALFDQKLYTEDLLVVMHLASECANGIKIEGENFESKGSTFEMMLAEEITSLPLFTDHTFFNPTRPYTVSKDSLINKIAVLQAICFASRSGVDVKQIMQSFPQGELREFFANKLIADHYGVGESKAVEIYLDLANDVNLSNDSAACMIGAAIRRDPEASSKIIALAPPSKARDQAIFELIQSSSFDDLEMAQEWLPSIADHNLRSLAKKALEHPRDYGTSPMKENYIFSDPDGPQ